MGPVSWMVDTVGGFVDGAAESSFGAVAGTLGGIMMVASTLLIILVFVNLSLQMRPMDGSTAVGLVVRLLLINAFALNWVQFNVVASAIIDGLDNIGAGIVEAVGGSIPAGGFASAFDEIMFEFSRYLNAMTQNMAWIGGSVATTFGMAMMGLLGALAGCVLIFSKVMLTLLIGIAPVMVATTLFDATKDYFHRWLSLFVGFAMYPIVIAGVMATVIGMAEQMAITMGNPAEGATLGSLMPFFAMMFLVGGMIGVIPFLVRSLSGNFVMPAISSVLGGDVARAGAGAVSGVISKNEKYQRRAHQMERERREKASWAEQDRMKQGGSSGGAQQGASSLQRQMESIRRLEAAGVIPSGSKPKPTIN